MNFRHNGVRAASLSCNVFDLRADRLNPLAAFYRQYAAAGRDATRPGRCVFYEKCYFPPILLTRADLSGRGQASVILMAFVFSVFRRKMNGPDLRAIGRIVLS